MKCLQSDPERGWTKEGGSPPPASSSAGRGHGTPWPGNPRAAACSGRHVLRDLLSKRQRRTVGSGNGPSGPPTKGRATLGLAGQSLLPREGWLAVVEGSRYRHVLGQTSYRVPVGAEEGDGGRPTVKPLGRFHLQLLPSIPRASMPGGERLTQFHKAWNADNSGGGSKADAVQQRRSKSKKKGSERRAQHNKQPVHIYSRSSYQLQEVGRVLSHIRGHETEAQIV